MNSRFGLLIVHRVVLSLSDWFVMMFCAHERSENESVGFRLWDVVRSSDSTCCTATSVKLQTNMREGSCYRKQVCSKSIAVLADTESFLFLAGKRSYTNPCSLLVIVGSRVAEWEVLSQNNSDGQACREDRWSHWFAKHPYEIVKNSIRVYRIREHVLRASFVDRLQWHASRVLDFLYSFLCISWMSTASHLSSSSMNHPLHLLEHIHEWNWWILPVSCVGGRWVASVVMISVEIGDPDGAYLSEIYFQFDLEHGGIRTILGRNISGLDHVNISIWTTAFLRKKMHWQPTYTFFLVIILALDVRDGVSFASGKDQQQKMYRSV